VKRLQPGSDLTTAYEALRAQATGQLPAITPRGLALFLAAGLPDWMTAWAPLAPTVPTVPQRPAASHHRAPPVMPGEEVVQLLTEMALGCQRRLTS
jgi:hypothetical protein